MVVVVDDEDRENEGDLNFAAEKAHPELINFMAKYGTWPPSVSHMTEERLDHPVYRSHDRREHLELWDCVLRSHIDARDGVTTGISSLRSRPHHPGCNRSGNTARGSRASRTRLPIASPQGGELVRAGQTEASVDLARMGWILVPAGSGSGEIMRDDGTMARVARPH